LLVSLRKLEHMNVAMSITPWMDNEEWNHVRQLVLNRDMTVLQHFAGTIPLYKIYFYVEFWVSCVSKSGPKRIYYLGIRCFS
jgi:hypothetical protein